MDEGIIPAVVRLNEAKTLLGVKSFYGCDHHRKPFSNLVLSPAKPKATRILLWGDTCERSADYCLNKAGLILMF
jgi:hypothetical protein